MKIDQVRVRLTIEEKELLKKRADIENLTMSSYIRHVLLKKDINK